MEMRKIPLDYQFVKPFFKYMGELCATSCFPDLLTLKVFPNAKEFTESCAAYNVFRQKLKLFDLSDKDVTIIAVADGNTPRTATMFAFRSAWQCISIDPRLENVSSWELKVQRLKCISKKIEDVEPMHFPKLAIVAVHSHAPLEVASQKFTASKRVIVSLPCCVKQEIGRPPDKEYIDYGIWSPQNKVKIWIEGARQ
jgi:hypothetical protein